LFEGPIDIVGDIHGEIEPLRHLLEHMGYDIKCVHPEGRRLVFLGDLVDRGPDSPAVVELVKQLVKADRAQCILGNHELNLLRDEPKDGNGWYTQPEKVDKYRSVPVSTGQKKGFREFLLTLPLALENDELRVVHACWNTKSLALLEKQEDHSSVLDAYWRFEGNLESDFVPENMTKQSLEIILRDDGNKPALIKSLADHDTAYQMGNPVRVLTSGEEAPASEAFWAGGKWRMVARQKWWDCYVDEKSVVVGHYWRHFDELSRSFGKKAGPDLFEGIESHHWMGKNDNVYCVDFSVGLRHKAKAENQSEDIGLLAALRWPEQVVMYHNGKSSRLGDQDKATFLL